MFRYQYYTSRIGLLDKLAKVSSPILLALQLIDIKNSQCVFSTAAVLSSAAHLPIKYLKLKTKTDRNYDQTFCNLRNQNFSTLHLGIGTYHQPAEID